MGSLCLKTTAVPSPLGSAKKDKTCQMFTLWMPVTIQSGVFQRLKLRYNEDIM